MKKLMALVAAVALSVVALGAQAQKPAGKMDKMDKGGKMSKMDKGGKMAKAATSTITGSVKGAPTGKTFVVTTASGAVTVDSSKAKFRDAKSKFVSASKLSAGATVEATGTMSGKTLNASNVKITSLTGDKPAGKMDKMSKGGKMDKMKK